MPLFHRSILPLLKKSELHWMHTFINKGLPRHMSNLAFTEKENIPDHTIDDVGTFYKVSTEEFEIVHKNFIKAEQVRLLQAFDENRFMIRSEGLKLVNIIQSYLNQCNSAANPTDLPPQLRLICHSRRGDGVSNVLAYVVHQAYKSKEFLISSWSQPHRFVRYSPDTLVNDRDPQSLDLPTYGVELLQVFLKMNKEVIETHDLKTTNEINWNLKESLPVGSSWLELIQFGIIRPKYSNWCLQALTEEMENLPKQTTALKRLFVMDGINVQWSEKTLITDPRSHQLVDAGQLTLIQTMSKQCAAVDNGRNRGSIVLGSTNKKAAWSSQREEDLPKYLLSDKGFKWLDPFYPLMVNPLSSREMDNFLTYLVDNEWITHEDAMNHNSIGWKEMKFLADSNIQELFNLSSEW